ncbi:hypothetical protein FACS1894132_07880 [Clostridia bacterium]|nr:hypothetical protein FACS1894132_07880 [Clostridia bacterium]
MAKIYSDNQIQEAKQTDLINFLKQTENLDFVQSGKSFRCIQHDSLIVTGDHQKFFFNSKNISGSAIDWLMKVQNNTFPNAMNTLVGRGAPAGISRHSSNKSLEKFAFSERNGDIKKDKYVHKTFERK